MQFVTTARELWFTRQFLPMIARKLLSPFSNGPTDPAIICVFADAAGAYRLGVCCLEIPIELDIALWTIIVP